MNKELSKNLVAIVLRNGAEIWAEKDRAEILIRLLEKVNQSKFIRFDGELFNTADVVGIFSAKVMEEITRRKNGQWKCERGNWHDRSKKCECWIQELSGDALAKYSRGF
jgi:hypothetical protein